MTRKILADQRPPAGQLAIADDQMVDPSALPGNAGVQIASSYGGPHGTLSVDFPAVVYASPQCTGS